MRRRAENREDAKALSPALRDLIARLRIVEREWRVGFYPYSYTLNELKLAENVIRYLQQRLQPDVRAMIDAEVSHERARERGER